jgi:hypothetical protein
LGVNIVLARWALAISLFCLSSSGGFTADIQIAPLKDNLSIISVSGEFTDGDDTKFKNLAISADSAVVIFDSIGGLVQVGMEIGRTIAIKGFSTAVSDNQICASSCGLAWLAGRHRFLTPTSKIGFHAAFTEAGGQQDVSSSGNALVGSYLQQLNLNRISSSMLPTHRRLRCGG